MLNIKKMYQHYRHLLNLREEYKYCKWNAQSFPRYPHIRDYYFDQACSIAQQYNTNKYWWMKELSVPKKVYPWNGGID